MKTPMVFKCLVLSSLALFTAFAPTTSAYAARTTWICQAVCMGVNSEAKSVMILGSRWATGKSRFQAFLDLGAQCRDLAEHQGLPESISTKKVSYRSLESSSSSSDWEMSASSTEGVSAGGSAYRSRNEVGASLYYSGLSSREVSGARSSTFSSSKDFELNVEDALMTDPEVCFKEELPANWIPPYMGYPGEMPPQG